MKELALVCSLFCFFSAAPSVAGSNHLEPVSGPFNTLPVLEDYHSRVKSVLGRGAEDAPLARMVILPSVGPESAVSIEGESGPERRVVYRIAEQRIWGNAEWEALGAALAEKTIDVSTAALIGEVFSTAIQQARYPAEYPFRLDGVNYYFISGTKAGTAWSPADDTVPGRLVAYGELLIRYVHADDVDAPQLCEVLRKEGQGLLDALDQYARNDTAP